jgi:hypothetical protein
VKPRKRNRADADRLLIREGNSRRGLYGDRAGESAGVGEQGMLGKGCMTELGKATEVSQRE